MVVAGRYLGGAPNPAPQGSEAAPPLALHCVAASHLPAEELHLLYASPDVRPPPPPAPAPVECIMDVASLQCV